MRTNAIVFFATFWIPLSASAAEAGPVDFPNHHLHNFGTSVRKLAIYEHALAMGYRLVVHEKPASPKYAKLRLIGTSNASVCPIRIFKNKRTGKTFVAYLGHLRDANGNSALAVLHGLKRRVGQRRPLTTKDLKLLKGYGAARRPIDDLTLANATYDEIRRRFYTKWLISSGQWVGFNVPMNWINKAVVRNCIKGMTTYFPWSRYQALFFDSLGDGAVDLRVTNANYFPGGTYASRHEGHLAFVKAVCEFARDPAKTGQPYPYLLFANIYDPLSKVNRKLCALKWYGENILRFDHYYLEKGAIRANGVVPGTTKPAYVDLGRNAPRHAYLPARLVAFDDVYGWSRKKRYLAHFDHAAFFEQHFKAAVGAAMQGSWFGWYGEDLVSKRDASGKLIYTNACQLLRALPNWDNMVHVPVPAFRRYKKTDARRWNGRVYVSPNSYASREVIYSRNPDNGELYVVFRARNAKVRLRSGEKLVAAFFVNDWFVKTDEDALPALRYDRASQTVTLADASKLSRGIRMTLAGGADR